MSGTATGTGSISTAIGAASSSSSVMVTHLAQGGGCGAVVPLPDAHHDPSRQGATLRRRHPSEAVGGSGDRADVVAKVDAGDVAGGSEGAAGAAAANGQAASPAVLPHLMAHGPSQNAAVELLLGRDIVVDVDDPRTYLGHGESTSYHALMARVGLFLTCASGRGYCAGDSCPEPSQPGRGQP